MTKLDNSKPQASVAPMLDAAVPSPVLAPVLGPSPASGPTPTVADDLDAQPQAAKSRDGLVVASIVIVAAAVAVMCHSQLGLPLSVSGAAGVVTLAFLMLIHKQMQKSAQIAQLKAELAQSRQAPRPRAAPVARVAPAPMPASTAEERIRELSRDIGNLVPRSDVIASDGLAPGQVPDPTSAPAASNMQPNISPKISERIARRPLRATAPPNLETASKPVGEANAVPAAPLLPAAEAPAGGVQNEQGREQWAFRPRNDAQASVQEASAAINSVNGGAQGPAASVAMTVEGDLELVQRKIKELADEVNAAEALRPKPQLVAQRPKGPPSALEDSIGALRAAAKSMRGRPSLGDFIPKLETPTPNSQPATMPAAAPAPRNEGFGELVIPATAERIAGSDFAPPLPYGSERDVASPNLELPLPDFTTAAAPTLPPHVASIARAVEDDAIDVLLGPIVTLSEHAVSHYEMTANLRSATGEALAFSEDDFTQIGGELDARFDIARFTRAAALAARMDARERDGSLLAEFLGSSMTSRAFLETFANAYETRQRISAQLVLTFSQRGVDEFSPAAWQAVRDMHAFGFRFALDKIRHVGTDFAALQRAGFRFVRLDAQTLLNGMATAERFVPAEEILQRATLAGLSIIASGIQDAASQKRLLDAGIVLGQGPLFGAPRQVNVAGNSAPEDQSAAA